MTLAVRGPRPMNPHPIRRKRRPVLTVALLLAATAWFGLTAPAAYAADEDDPNKSSSQLGVAVPSVVPGNPGPTPRPDPTTPSDGTTPGGGGKTPGGGGNVSGGGVKAPGGGGNVPGGGSSNSCTPAEPALPSQPATSGEDATLDKDVYLVGEQVTAAVGGFGAGEQVQLVLFSEPSLIGTFTADDSGSLVATFPVAKGTLPGTHTVQFTGWCEKIALADILIGSDGALAASGQQGVPPWIWWAGGGLGVLAVVIGGWWAVRAMRGAPQLGAAVAQ